MLRYLFLSIIIAAGCSSEDLTKPVKVPPKTRAWSTRHAPLILSSIPVTPYLRSDLESMLIGKTPEEVTIKIGEPHIRIDDTWEYKLPSVDKAKQKTSYSFTIHWIHDSENWNLVKVEKLSFE
ncbi:MAG: hypothetical protein JNJ77_04830 [Planctomycetia bacterium]|nr:hypothetical protein [Planctomycetia bacterium]